MIKAFRVQLAIAEVNMTGMDGPTFVAAMRKAIAYAARREVRISY